MQDETKRLVLQPVTYLLAFCLEERIRYVMKNNSVGDSWWIVVRDDNLDNRI